jgi:protoporphyrinogen oxidase
VDLLTANDRPGAYPASWYAATATPLPPFPEHKGEAAADVCVVGGGYTGLSAALHLAEAGYDVVLLEAQRVGWGASGRNGGQVGTGMRQDQDWLERVAGRERARAFWDLGLEAVATPSPATSAPASSTPRTSRPMPPNTRPMPTSSPATTATTRSTGSTGPPSPPPSAPASTTAAPATGAPRISTR